VEDGLEQSVEGEEGGITQIEAGMEGGRRSSLLLSGGRAWTREREQARRGARL